MVQGRRSSISYCYLLAEGAALEGARRISRGCSAGRAKVRVVEGGLGVRGLFKFRLPYKRLSEPTMT